MSTRRASSYAEVSASVRAIKSRMLGRAGYDRLLRCSSSSECFSFLIEQGYLEGSAATAQGPDPTSWQSLVEARITAVTHRLARLSPRECAQLLVAFEKRYRLESLKATLRRMISREEEMPTDMAASRLGTESVPTVVEGRGLERLTRATGAEVLHSEISSAIAENWPLPLLESMVDKHGLAMLWRASEMPNWVDKQSVQRLIGEHADRANLLAVVRSKTLGIAEDEIRRLLVPVDYHLGDVIAEAVSSSSTTNALRAFMKTPYAGIVGQFLETFKEGDSLHPLDNALQRLHAGNCLAVFSGFPFCAGLPLALAYLMSYEVSDVQSIALGKEDRLSTDRIEELLVLWKTL